jgi:hypothetical protein
MKKLVLVALLAAPFIPATAQAQNAFDGTWKIDIQNAQFPAKPDTILLKDGVYECATCVPPVKVKADGMDHAVTGSPYRNTAAIKVVDDHTIQETDKKNGKVVATSTVVVSSDGKTATAEFTDSSDTNSAPVTGKVTMIRVAAGPAGAHAVSGEWKMGKMEAVSDNSLLFTLKIEGDTVHWSQPTGQSYAAKLDGPDAAYEGDPGVSTVSVKRIDKNTIEESDKDHGKTLYTTRMTVSADGKSMTLVNRDVRRGTDTKYTAKKQ